MVLVKTFKDKRNVKQTVTHSVKVFCNDILKEQYNKLDCIGLETLLKRINHKTIEHVNVASKKDL